MKIAQVAPLYESVPPKYYGGTERVVSYLTEQRRREFGLRMAVGATGSDILTMVLKQGFRKVAAGLALGLAISFVVTRFLAAMLHEVPALDPATFALASAVLVVVMLAATLVPARRASRLDPTLAIRSE